MFSIIKIWRRQIMYALNWEKFEDGKGELEDVIQRTDNTMAKK